jgi:ADP-ribose pyrophosphatase YjhB (NUDIX family)
MEDSTPKWLAWARELFSLAQAGLTYNNNEFDLERYRRLHQISAEIIASQSSLDNETITKSLSMQAGYATPKIDVRGAVIQERKILLVQERSDGKWSMPGGWADLGDSPSETAAREVWEESGFNVKVDKLVAVYDANRIPGTVLEFYHAYKLIFLCSIIGGEVRTSNETLAVDFFLLDHLPPLSTYRTNQQMLDEVFAHFRNPARQTAFD